MTSVAHRVETITPGDLIGLPGVLLIDCACGTEMLSTVAPGEGERDVIDRGLAGHLAEFQATR